MQWRIVGLGILAAVSLWVYVMIPLNILAISNTSINAYAITISSTPTGSPTSSPTSKPASPSSATTDSTTFPAWITIASPIVVALIGFGAIMYQQRPTAKIEKEKVAAQLELERERIRFQANRADQERQRQRKEMTDE